jgi:hypothetical protein
MNLNLMAVGAVFVAGLISCQMPQQERSKLPGYGKGAPVGQVMGRPKMLTMDGADANGSCFGQPQLLLGNPGQENLVSITNEEEFIAGSPRSCISINIPDASKDDKLLEMYAGFKAMAMPMLLNQSLQSRNAIIIDLRTNAASQFKRVDYQVSGPGFTMPVLVKWDVNAAARFTNLLSLAKEVPGISITQTAEEYHH